jgi:hypothetical protein
LLRTSRLHLSTLFVMTLITSVFVGLNASPRDCKAIYVYVDDHVSLSYYDNPARESGWPLIFQQWYDRPDGRRLLHLDWSALAIDLAVMGLGLGVAFGVMTRLAGSKRPV